MKSFDSAFRNPVHVWNISGGIFDIAGLQSELADLEAQMSAPAFWDHKEKAQEVMTRAGEIRNIITPFQELAAKVEDLAVTEELADMEEGESELLEEAGPLHAEIGRELDKLELTAFLSGKMDRNNAILTVHAGAGGTESCDWAEMLLRMYMRWFERRGFTTEMVDTQPGDEAGIKSATVIAKGPFAFGDLRGENGVHRLVRISPFDANKRRHTSFAAVDVVPEVDDTIDIDINESDLRVDTFRASGAGGQHVNRTDSAVRFTHLPTGVVVACQSERSQHKNRATAMKILKAKLYELEEKKRRAEQQAMHGEKQENAWGSQIRSYVLQPYQMVKDLRTGQQTSNVQAVLDGDIDAFIEAFLRSEDENSGQ